MNPLELTCIGNTGVKVTRLGLGGAPLSGMTLVGGLFGGAAREEAMRIIKLAFDLGIKYFDTAPLYGTGRSEARYGDVLPTLPRDSFVLSTKVGRILKRTDAVDTPDDDELLKLEPVFDLSRDGILKSVEESLRRLKLDSVEILFLHDPDTEALENEAMATAFPTMLELREQGVVKAIGCGMNQWQVPARFIKAIDLDVVLLAGRFTLLDHDAFDEFLPLCLERNVKLVIGGPYNSGILARDLDKPVSFNYTPAPQPWIDRARALKKVCDRHDVSLKATALQYVSAHPTVVSVIPGVGSVSELEENVRLAAVEIPSALWEELKEERLIPQTAVTP